MHRILVTGVGSNIGQGILQSIRAAEIPCEIVGTDMFRFAAGFAWCQAAHQVPHSQDAAYLPSLKAILKKHRIELVLIGSDLETLVLARARAEIEKETGCRVAVSDARTVERLADKWLLVEGLRAMGVDHPDSTSNMDERHAFAKKHGFPLLLKPRHGQSARNVHRVDDAATLDFLAARVGEPVLQEFLEGEEYTCALVFDRDGEFRDHVVMRRELLNGTTFRAEVVDRPAIDAYVRAFAKHVKPVGSINVQLRLTPRGPVAFEVNPRFSGTTSLRMRAGFNDVAAVVRNLLEGTPIAPMHARRCHILRFWDEVVVDSSDPRFPR